ncbi:AMIN domain-containing protein, partial [Cereibacter changlensis]
MRGVLSALALIWASAVGAQELTAVARLDPAASHVEDVRRGVGLELALSQPVPWRVRVMDQPPRLVLDFREVDFTGIGAVEEDSDRVLSLRAGVYRPGWSRLVLELDGPYTVSEAGMTTGNATRVSVRLARASAEEFAKR